MTYTRKSFQKRLLANKQQIMRETRMFRQRQTSSPAVDVKDGGKNVKFRHEQEQNSFLARKCKSISSLRFSLASDVKVLNGKTHSEPPDKMPTIRSYLDSESDLTNMAEKQASGSVMEKFVSLALFSQYLPSQPFSLMHEEPSISLDRRRLLLNIFSHHFNSKHHSDSADSLNQALCRKRKSTSCTVTNGFTTGATCSRTESKGELQSLLEDEDEQLTFIKYLVKDPVCFTCEELIQSEAPLKCTQPHCPKTFHINCCTVADAFKFKCGECASDIKICFLCLKPKDVVRCSIEDCLKQYHRSCLRNYLAAIFDEEVSSESPNHCRGDIVCPFHFCASCTAWKRKPRFVSRVNFVSCIKCPTAYHLAEQCIPAGTLVLNNQFVICTNHSDPKLSRVNVNYCFLCGKGGTLLLCERCPVAVHPDCYGLDKIPEGSFYCTDCSMYRKPSFGDIVWAKYGGHRWWPALIVPPLSVPDNVERLLNKRNNTGEFAVLFYGTHNYGIVSQGRVFQFVSEDKNKSVKKSCLDKAFAAAVLEAQEALKIKTMQEDFLPPIFKRIRSNRFSAGMKPPPLDLDNYPICHCGGQNSHYCEELCENRSMWVECHPKLCPCGEKCRNQRFQKCQYALTIPFKTANRGWGLRALEDIAKGDFVTEYVGEIISVETCQKRLKLLKGNDSAQFYFLTLDRDRIIDAGPMGNNSRFMNHSCDPNCRSEVWQVANDIRIGLFASRNIQRGEELTFHYNLDSTITDLKETKCKCGSDNCRGVIGELQKGNGHRNKSYSLEKTNCRKFKKRSLQGRKKDDVQVENENLSRSRVPAVDLPLHSELVKVDYSNNQETAGVMEI